jgi:hypothetical protein
MIFTLLPAGAVAQAVDLGGHRVQQPAGLGVGRGRPAVIIVIWPAGGLGGAAGDGRVQVQQAHGLEPGASSATDQRGSTVEHITKTLPGCSAAATAPLPKSTSSVCAALTTTETTTPQCAATSAGLAQAVPPSAAKACGGFGPHIAHMHVIAGAAQRSGHAAAHGAQADQADVQGFWHGSQTPDDGSTL